MDIGTLRWVWWWGCRWAAARIQAALDDDPDGRLDLRDLERLVTHLAQCRRCRSMTADYQGLAASLDRIAARAGPDPAVVRRLQHLAAAHPHEENP
jgi:predicted anti-sigma-YlaC factor YlaD